MLYIQMKQTSKGWVGYYGQKTDRFIPFICEQGSTPEEVTEKLWNAAKKKSMTSLLG